MSLRRREFLRRMAIAGPGLALAAPAARGAADAAEAKAVTPADAFDGEIAAFMAARRVPGGALAVARRGRIVYARGYGWADRKKKIPVRPDSLFRIASVTKPITAVAVLQLVEKGRLDLDAPAFGLLSWPAGPTAGRTPDARLRQITIRQLLHHTGGWDRDKSFDPMFRPRRIARALGVPGPAGPDAVIRYMLGQPLDFDPGTRYAYSNFGYCVLGRIIEKVTGRDYGPHVRENVLAPLGIERMRIGASLDGQAADGEVRYYTSGNKEGDSVFVVAPTKVPLPYGGFHLEAMDAHGGWIASAIDVVRFAAALDDPARSPLLRPETLRLMYAPPAPPVFHRADGTLEDHYYGCGWMVRPIPGHDGQANYWHTGSLPGTATMLVRRWDGVSYAVLFNQRSEDKNLPDDAIDPALHRAADRVTRWEASPSDATHHASQKSV